jgi:Uma2 family endonuclease
MTTAVAVEQVPFTYEDYLRLPDSPYREEILVGELIVSPSPSRDHQELVGGLYRALQAEAGARGLGKVYLGPYDVILSDTDVVSPDLVFVLREQAGIARQRGVFGPPDLIVEVLSKWSGVRDTQGKSALYARYGVPHYWLFDPARRRAWFFRLAEGEYRLTGEHGGDEMVRVEPFPDLELHLGGLWPPETPETSAPSR